MAATSFKLTSSDERYSWPRCHSTAKKNPVRTGSVRSDICEYNEDIEIIHHLKKKRSSALAFLTRKRNKVEPLLIDDVDNLPVVNTKMEEYASAFERFCQASEAYDNVVKDSEGKAKSFMYFMDVKGKFLEFCQTVTSWVTAMEAKLEDIVSKHGASKSDETSSSSSRTSKSSTTHESPLSSSSIAAKSDERFESPTLTRISELEARRASIQRRQELHERELRMKEESLKIEIERERIELEEELNALKAKKDNSSLKLNLGDNSSAKLSTKERSSKTSSKASKEESSHNVKPPKSSSRSRLKEESSRKVKPPKSPSKSSLKEEPSSTPEEKFAKKSSGKTILINAADLIPPELFRTYSHDRDVLEQQNKIWNDTVLQQQRATLPKQHVLKFNGDPLEYCSFVRAFDILIACKEPDYSSKLYYLEQYTTGCPQELVKSCLHMKPEEGYKKARVLLESRFGDKYKIAMAHVEKLLAVPPIKPEDADALEKYSISLASCKNALEGIGYLNKIENPDVMRKIIEKLPYRFQDKWRDVADNIINVKHREVTMEDIASYVEPDA